MSGERRQLIVGERATLDPFIASPDDGVSPRDQRDLMERPFFSLAKSKRTKPILYKTGDTQVQVHAVPEFGMATIWDADVLIWAATQIVEATDQGLRTSRFFRFTPYQLLIATGRGTGFRQYKLLKGALQRLQSTVSSSPGSTNGRNSLIRGAAARASSSSCPSGSIRVSSTAGSCSRSTRPTFGSRAASSAGSTALPASTPAASRTDGPSRSGICTPSLGAWPGSRTSPSTYAALRRANLCQAIVSASSGKTDATFSGSRRGTLLGYPQPLWTSLWKDSVHQAHALSVLRAHDYRYIRRTDRHQATSPLLNLATVTSLTQENLTFVLGTVVVSRYLPDSASLLRTGLQKIGLVGGGLQPHSTPLARDCAPSAPFEHRCCKLLFSSGITGKSQPIRQLPDRRTSADSQSPPGFLRRSQFINYRKTTTVKKRPAVGAP